MAQDLPDDVWIQVAETQWKDQEALQNVSLTSRRMRRLVVPVIFRDLEFQVVNAKFHSLLAMLIRANLRARFLFNSPELLRHTRFFFLWENVHTEDLITSYLSMQTGSDESSWRGDVVNLLTVLHDAIFRLIFRMPGLRELHICHSVMTPLLYAAVTSRPLLTTLSLELRHISDVTYTTPAVPYSLRLRYFAYYDIWVGIPGHHMDLYLTDLLDHCIFDLESLVINSFLLPRVVSHIPSHHTLSLRSLNVWFPLDLSDGQDAVAFLQLLRICPQIRHLGIHGQLPDVEPARYLPPPVLPNLSTISGTTRLLQIVSSGAELTKIYIDDSLYIEDQLLTQIIRSSPIHLRELSLERVVVSQTPHELLRFIKSIAVFQNLQRMTIAYKYDMPWKDHVSAQDSHTAITDLLDQLSGLRFLEIQSNGYDPVKGYDVGCPISKKDELAERGHPSLEAIYVDFICGRWSWDYQTGWEEGPWEVP